MHNHLMLHCLLPSVRLIRLTQISILYVRLHIIDTCTSVHTLLLMYVHIDILYIHIQWYNEYLCMSVLINTVHSHHPWHLATPLSVPCIVLTSSHYPSFNKWMTWQNFGHLHSKAHYLLTKGITLAPRTTWAFCKVAKVHSYIPVQ